ncbi:MAG: corrinoid protein [candidate division KSB1 bacterium]|nr:corrinoid protein [candidate division KSB1 bacterium]MDZ7334300.1 corrinoid protein [candidate division KSB1 bacterium]MDZ7356482.1 corrinoid protein [candidate division KSB1 bacterium]MDZ7400489.1 corrinoid protein [candidate division KSB1 bacterium]
MELLQQIANSVITGKANETETLVKQALDANIPVRDILNQGLIAAMDVVGTKFKNNEFYVPEVLIAARAMKAGMKLLKPRFAESGVASIAKLALGTVKGDLHDIGKNLVAMMLEGAGFEIIDLGVDVAPEKFVQAVRQSQAQVVGMSALLTTTMLNMKATLQALKDEGLRDSVKVIIGGAPVTQSYADEIGADGYAPDAATAVTVVKQLLKLH